MVEMNNKADTSGVYSDGEMKFMRWGQKLREKMMRPLLVFLNNWNITPNWITTFSLIAGGIAALLIPGSPLFALIFLYLHVLLDGIDGPYARFSGMRSRKGERFDIVSDQAIVILTSLALVKALLLSPANGWIYAALYTAVVIVSVERNKARIPYKFLVRPRFVVYFWLLLELLFIPNSLEYVVILCNIVLAIQLVSGILKLKSLRRVNGKNNQSVS